MSMNEAAVQYLRWLYDHGVWKRMQYRGIPILKLPSDLWNYQEIISERRIDWVLETGTRHGGSALFFADLLELNGAAGHVISVDVDAKTNKVRDDPRIDFLVGDSASSAIVEQVQHLLPRKRGPLFAILDSDHAKAHVLRELEAYLSLLQKGDYLVVEDTCLNGHPVRPEFGPGPYEALQEFLAKHSGQFARDEAREEKFGLSFAPAGYLIKT